MNNYRRLLSLAMVIGLATQMITSCGGKDDHLPEPADPVLTSFPRQKRPQAVRW